MRPACHVCPYASLKRESDITLGDHWNVKIIDSEFWDKNGVSLVILNSETGKLLFSKAEKHLHICQRSEEECLQKSLLEPVDKNTKRELFWKLYSRNKSAAIILIDCILLFEKITEKIVRR